MPNPRSCPQTNLPLDGLDAIKAIREGVRPEIADELIAQGIIPPAQIYKLICSKRTLDRRRSREERLTPPESERLVRVLRVVRHAEESFGDAAKAGAYLSRPLRRFEHQSCIEMLDTGIGAVLVGELLARIDHGIPG